MFLNHGLFNLGFVAFNDSLNAMNMINWWAERMQTKCFCNLKKGFFVDQLQMNLLPIFFDKVCVSKNMGLNMANWNLHERTLSKLKDGRYMVNEEIPLIFFHYSNFNPNNLSEISWGRQNRFDINNNLVLKSIFEFYSTILLNNKYNELKRIPCYYITKRDEKLKEQYIEKLKNEKVKYKMARCVKQIMPKKIFNTLRKFVEL
jgi:hypothetical protein